MVSAVPAGPGLNCESPSGISMPGFHIPWLRHWSLHVREPCLRPWGLYWRVENAATRCTDCLQLKAPPQNHGGTPPMRTELPCCHVLLCLTSPVDVGDKGTNSQVEARSYAPLWVVFLRDFPASFSSPEIQVIIDSGDHPR